jgi:hypothetical protein
VEEREIEVLVGRTDADRRTESLAVFHEREHRTFADDLRQFRIGRRLPTHRREIRPDELSGGLHFAVGD